VVNDNVNATLNNIRNNLIELREQGMADSIEYANLIKEWQRIALDLTTVRGDN